MKTILISIKPKWVAAILNGKKTIEIRKTCPKQLRGDTPIKPEPIVVYIYCTKDKPYLANATELFTGKYGCISNDDVSYEEHNLNGKVVGKFTLNKVEKITPEMWSPIKEKEVLNSACLNEFELFDYISKNNGESDNPFYAWHIDNLEIFDKPKELCEFKTYKTYNLGDLHNCHLSLTKAPQSWCYVEVLS